MKNVASADKPFILGTRIGLVAVFFLLGVLIKIAWRKKRLQAEKMR
jgi:hypothetical protein